MEKIIDLALRYKHDLGLNVIPMRAVWNDSDSKYDKVPLVSWTDYQDKEVTDSDIRSWWSKYPDAGIAAVLGSISRNVIVIDCDTNKAIDEIEELLPDGQLIISAKSISGKRHYYFRSDKKIQKKVRFYADMDMQAEKSLIAMPPTKGRNGDKYEWIVEPKSADDFPALASSLMGTSILNNISTLYIGDVTNAENQKKEVLHSVTFSLDKGSRDETLYHIAHCLFKGGASAEDTRNVLNILADRCNPRFPEREIESKIKSVLDRAERKERNLSKEISDFVGVTSGYFSVTSCYSVLHLVTKSEKTSARVSLNRLKDKGIIEKHPTQDGVYRKVETNFDFITFDENEEPEIEYPVRLPLGLNDLAEISQGNIILVAGEFNAGKTSFLFDVLKNNKGKVPIRYITSEMSKSEFKKRFASFGLPLSFWMQDSLT
jgi:hypothetical protein